MNEMLMMKVVQECYRVRVSKSSYPIEMKQRYISRFIGKAGVEQFANLENSDRVAFAGNHRTFCRWHTLQTWCIVGGDSC